MHLYEDDSAPSTIPKSRSQRDRPATISGSPTDQKTACSVQPSWVRDDENLRGSILIPGLNILANVAAAAEPNLQYPTQMGSQQPITNLRDVEEMDIAEAIQECENLLSDSRTSQPANAISTAGHSHDTTPKPGLAKTTPTEQTCARTTPVLVVPFPTLQHPNGPRAAPAHGVKQSVEKLRRTNSEALASDTRPPVFHSPAGPNGTSDMPPSGRAE